MEQILQLITFKESVRLLVTERTRSLFSISISEMQTFCMIAAIFQKICASFCLWDELSGFDRFT